MTIKKRSCTELYKAMAICTFQSRMAIGLTQVLIAIAPDGLLTAEVDDQSYQGVLDYVGAIPCGCPLGLPLQSLTGAFHANSPLIYRINLANS